MNRYLNPHRNRRRTGLWCATVAVLMSARPAHASMFKGETLDAVAEALAWVVLILVPIVGIVAFWLVHILPEKIAHKRGHPQTAAIQCLCLLSLVFGGLLWPIAWLWAYSKPVLYKMAYGTDKLDHDHPPGEPGSDATGAKKQEGGAA